MNSGRMTGDPEVTVVNKPFHQLSQVGRIVGVNAMLRQLRQVPAQLAVRITSYLPTILKVDGDKRV
jgi:hypothetical protein